MNTTALDRRRSTRRYLSTPVSQAQIERILVRARRAPSGANLQPGFVRVLTGDAKHQLSQQLLQAFWQGSPQQEAYSYFPKPMPAYLKARQRAVGFALYASLGIDKRDTDARKQQHARNFKFFDAPIVLLVSIDSDMGAGCYMDLGMLVQSLFLAAEDEGLATCGIGALASYPDLIKTQLQMGDGETLVCGIALGYADPDAPENQWQSERAPLAEYSEFIGF